MGHRGRAVTVVITPGRIFAFGNNDLARKFARRARRLPSLAGQTVEVVSASVFTGRPFSLARVKDRDAEMMAAWEATAARAVA